MFRFLPEPASEIAPLIDWLHNLLTDLSVFFTVVIVGAMVYFAIRYRRRDNKDHETPQIHGSHTLEAIWTAVPAVICVLIAYYGSFYFTKMREVPKDALTINVWGEKWRWEFEYQNGKRIRGQYPQFVVPVNKAVKLVMQSRDVLHSFFIPAMRVKMDVIPGHYTYLSFKPVKTGSYPVFCTEYCGDYHWNMLAGLKVVSEAEYERWLEDRSDEATLSGLSPGQRGQKIYSQHGCNACHSLDGSQVVGPSFLKLYGRKGTVNNGQAYEADDNYIKESILNPLSKIVDGFPKSMTSFEGRIEDEEISDIIAFIKTLDGSSPVVAAPAPKAEDAEAWESLTPVQRGERLFREKSTPPCATCHSLDGTKIVGPSLKGIFGRSGELEGGTQYIADEAYIRKSILDSMSQVVSGYSPSMPPYQASLKDRDVNDIMEYLKTVK